MTVPDSDGSLGLLALGAGVFFLIGSAAASAAVDKPAEADPLNRRVLKEADFVYVGSFRLPEKDGKVWSTSFSMSGLTHRYVEGKLQFLTASHAYGGGLVYEIDYPGISTSAPFPQAKVLKHWGDVYTGHRWTANDGGSSNLNGTMWTYGLYYDQVRKRLYWNYGHWYNAQTPFNPSLGYSVFDDVAGTVKGMGSWSLARRQEKFARGGTLRIPQWFADRFTQGKSLGVGFGGYFSIASGASFGPALAAVSDPDLKTNPNRSALANVPLLGYPLGASDRAHRDPDYKAFYDGGQYPNRIGPWNPKNGIGYWTSSDIIFGGATWLDLPGAHGVLFLAKVGQGNVWYEKSDRHADRGAYEWFVYDPRDLAAVASGRKQQWQIQPKHSWIDQLLPMELDKKGWSGDGLSMVGGATFDPRTNRLYVLVLNAWRINIEFHPQVYVYQLPGKQ